MRQSNSSSRRRQNDTKKPRTTESKNTSGKKTFKEKSIRNKPTEKERFSKTNKDNSTRNKPVEKERFSKPNVKYRDFKSDREKVKNPVKTTTESENIRLNKYLSNAGICSRREADVYIKAGNVTVNGKTVTEMGHQVQPGDVVKFDGTSISPEKKQYLLLNKPKDYITTLDDEKGRKTVMDLVEKATKERIYPVGRLDRNTTGLLLFTNDGDLAKKLTHPKHRIQKIYHVTLDQKVSMEHLNKIMDPDFTLEELPVYVDSLSYVEGGPKSEVGIEIHSGRNRIVRKIFEHFGYKVVKLDRVLFAGLTKKDLPRGKWRFLTEQEIINLRMIK